VATQLRHSGGLLYTLGGARLWVDPGPGALVRALASRPKVDPSRVDALLLTHRHLDHAGDATAVVEAMTAGGTRRRGALFAPAEALDLEPMVLRYAQGFLARVERLCEGGSYAVAPGLSLTTPLAHDHGVETYGYRLAAAGLTVGHVVDTFWMDRLLEAYAGVDLLIVNTTLIESGPRRLLHLGADQAERLVAGIRPRLAVLTHFGMTVLRARPDLVAEGIAQRTGVRTLAARDGLALPLDPLLPLSESAAAPTS
jgi:phosphoribosyl 1,2-cyclic phosphodiesterase